VGGKATIKVSGVVFYFITTRQLEPTEQKRPAVTPCSLSQEPGCLTVYLQLLSTTVQYSKIEYNSDLIFLFIVL
jgi:hypothetical protein